MSTKTIGVVGRGSGWQKVGIELGSFVFYPNSSQPGMFQTFALSFCIGASIRTGREIWCLLYAGFFWLRYGFLDARERYLGQETIFWVFGMFAGDQRAFPWCPGAFFERNINVLRNTISECLKFCNSTKVLLRISHKLV